MLGYQKVQIGTNVHLSDDIVHLNNNYREMQGLFEAVNYQTTAVGMRINVSKAKVASALLPCEQCQNVLLDGEALENAGKFKCLGSTLIASGKATEEMRSRITLARSTV